jgi:ATP synthase mitochondrial F1 complex assembly factor 2
MIVVKMQERNADVPSRTSRSEVSPEIRIRKSEEFGSYDIETRRTSKLLFIYHASHSFNMRTKASKVAANACCFAQNNAVPRIPNLTQFGRALSVSIARPATTMPITAVGPPPAPPQPSAKYHGERVARKLKQMEMLQKGKEIRTAQTSSGGKPSPLRKRFWNDVHVLQTADGYQVSLDKRPVRTPNKSVLTIPLSKPQLAHAIALEWDLLVSTQQALKNHNIPMTSIASRAQDIIESESATPPNTKTRDDITKTLIRYLDTDTLLCWAPEVDPHAATTPLYEMHATRQESLREIQKKSAIPIISHLTTNIWPGIDLHPILDTDSIVPKKQPEATRAVIRGWIAGLPAYELAALESGVLASKSLLVATRLLVDWSEHYRELHNTEQRFGIEEAAEACSLEVRWQTRMWGEVEDTHDVDKEDVRRQLGSVILMVSGFGTGS